MDVQFPLIYCSRHPHYQLNLICRHPTCSEKGALCCRCQLSRHNGNGHTFESFVPLDEILILSHEACEEQYIDMEQSAYELIRRNREGAVQLELQMSAIQEIIHEKIRDDFIAIGQLQQGYRDIGGLANQMLVPPETTPTDEGVSVKEVFLASMIMIADKIIIKDGEFALDKSDLLDSISTIVKRKQSAIIQLDKVYKNANLQMQGLKKLLKMGCMLGIDQNLPLSLFNDWIVIYNEPYSHPTDITNIVIPSETIVCVGAVRDERLIICAIDYGHVFIQLNTLNEVDSNGIHWYLEKGKSFGFSDMTSTLNGSDIFPGDQKLSWRLDGCGGFRAGNQLHLQESLDLHDTRDLVKALRAEVAHYKQQMGVLSLQKDEVTFELNKLMRYVERMELQLKEKEGEIVSLKQQKVEQEGYFQRQIEDLKYLINLIKGLTSNISRNQLLSESRPNVINRSSRNNLLTLMKRHVLTQWVRFKNSNQRNKITFRIQRNLSQRYFKMAR